MQARTEANTNPTIFLRLNALDAKPREIAWNEFDSRYSPIIAGFAAQLGARQQDIDDIVQEVLLGFFMRSPSFIYDPSKGRFRGYLKVCTYHVLKTRLGKQARLNGRPLDEVDPESVAFEQVWNDIWEQELLRRALDEIRREMGESRTFRAFELYHLFDETGEAIAQRLDMHINSVYRAKDEVMRTLQAKLSKMRDEP